MTVYDNKLKIQATELQSKCNQIMVELHKLLSSNDIKLISNKMDELLLNTLKLGRIEGVLYLSNKSPS